MCISLCITVAHKQALNSSDTFPSYPPDSSHSPDVVYWGERGGDFVKIHPTIFVNRADTQETRAVKLPAPVRGGNKDD